MYGAGHTVQYYVYIYYYFFCHPTMCSMILNMDIYCLRLIDGDFGFTSRMGYVSVAPYHWRPRPSETACVEAAGGGTGSTAGNEKQRPVSRLSYHASGAPPPNVAGCTVL